MELTFDTLFCVNLSNQTKNILLMLISSLGPNPESPKPPVPIPTKSQQVQRPNQSQRDSRNLDFDWKFSISRSHSPGLGSGSLRFPASVTGSVCSVASGGRGQGAGGHTHSLRQLPPHLSRDSTPSGKIINTISVWSVKASPIYISLPCPRSTD